MVICLFLTVTRALVDELAVMDVRGRVCSRPRPPGRFMAQTTRGVGSGRPQTP